MQAKAQRNPTNNSKITHKIYNAWYINAYFTAIRMAHITPKVFECLSSNCFSFYFFFIFFTYFFMDESFSYGAFAIICLFCFCETSLYYEVIYYNVKLLGVMTVRNVP